LVLPWSHQHLARMVSRRKGHHINVRNWRTARVSPNPHLPSRRCNGSTKWLHIAATTTYIALNRLSLSARTHPNFTCLSENGFHPVYTQRKVIVWQIWQGHVCRLPQQQSRSGHPFYRWAIPPVARSQLLRLLVTVRCSFTQATISYPHMLVDASNVARMVLILPTLHRHAHPCACILSPTGSGQVRSLFISLLQLSKTWVVTGDFSNWAKKSLRRPLRTPLHPLHAFVFSARSQGRGHSSDESAGCFELHLLLAFEISSRPTLALTAYRSFSEIMLGRGLASRSAYYATLVRRASSKL